MTFTQLVTCVYSITPYSITNKPEDYGTWTQTNNIQEVTRESRLEGERIHVGGTRGGSCWDDGDSHHEGYTREHGPIEITCLEDILAELCPTITFL